MLLPSPSLLLSLTTTLLLTTILTLNQPTLSSAFSHTPTFLPQTFPPSQLNATPPNQSSHPSILVRACQGLPVPRPPIWMMRQAGRHISAYRSLVKHHPTFRERSETPSIAAEISLQPYRNYKTDGCIIFSDILTPLPGMGVEFTIEEGSGPKVVPFTSMTQVDRMHLIDPIVATPFLGETFRILRDSITPETALLGFIGCPYTISTYVLEGGSSKDFKNTKNAMYTNPEMMHSLLTKLTESLIVYAGYQIDSGAQVIQLFDSWSGNLSPADYDIFALPYQKRIVAALKEKYPEIPLIMYINKSGALLERMVQSGIDVISLDWTVDMAESRLRIDNECKRLGIGKHVGVQGNLDPSILLHGSDEVIKERTLDILKKGRGGGHVMNLGHGIEAETSEVKAKFFVDLVKGFVY